MEVVDTAGNILDLYESNEVAAELNYTGKWAEITGKIEKIESKGDRIEVNLVGVGDLFPLASVVCKTPQGQASAAAQLRKGDVISIRGKILGVPGFSNVVVEPCEIFEGGPGDRATTRPTAKPVPTPTLAPAPVPTATPTSVPSPVPTATTVGKVRTNPMPAGSTVTTDDGLAITVMSVDADAWPELQAENSFNDPPKEGHQFTFVEVRIQVVDSSFTNETSISYFDFDAVGSSGVVFDGFDCGVIPNELSATMFQGGSLKETCVLKYQKMRQICWSTTTVDTVLPALGFMPVK